MKSNKREKNAAAKGIIEYPLIPIFEVSQRMINREKNEKNEVYRTWEIEKQHTALRFVFTKKRNL